MRFKVRGDAVGAGQGNRDEVHRLLQAVVGFGATEAEEAAAGFAEAFWFYSNTRTESVHRIDLATDLLDEIFDRVFLNGFTAPSLMGG